MTIGEFFDLCNQPLMLGTHTLATLRNMEEVLHLILWEAKECYNNSSGGVIPDISFWALNIPLQVVHDRWSCPLNEMHAGIVTYSMAVIASRFLRETGRDEWNPKTLTALRKIAGSVNLDDPPLPSHHPSG
jgi:hypothetical protein